MMEENMRGGRRHSDSCAFCQKPLRRPVSRRKADLRPDGVDRAPPESLQDCHNSLPRVLAVLGPEVKAKVGGAPPMCVHCAELVAEVELCRREIAELQQRLEASVRMLRGIVEDGNKSNNLGGEMMEVAANFDAEEKVVAEEIKVEADVDLNEVEPPNNDDDNECETSFSEEDETGPRTDPLAQDVEAKKFPCPVPQCLKRFMHRRSIKLHLLSHSRKPKCILCWEPVKRDQLLEHFSQAHPSRTVFQCGLCYRIFFERDSWLNHHTNRHSKLAITCDLCPSTFSDANHCRKHLFEEHQLGNQFLCEHCPATFFTPASLRQHVKWRHLGKKMSLPTISCEVCSAEFRRKSALVTHKMKEHGDTGAGFRCEVCGKMLTNPGFLKLHFDRAHRGLRKRHVHPKEPGVKPFVCEVAECGKRFYDEVKLNLHKYQHPATNPVCEVCGQTFSSFSSLKRHYLVHTGERPHTCHLCGQRFRHKVTLTTHLRSHAEKGDKFKPSGEMKERQRPRKTKRGITN